MKPKTTRTSLSRRQFHLHHCPCLGGAGIPPGRCLGQEKRPSASNRITMAMIGCGWQGGSNMGGFLDDKKCQVVAVCDLDKDIWRKRRTPSTVVTKNQDCKTYHDYRELLAADGH